MINDAVDIAIVSFPKILYHTKTLLAFLNNLVEPHFEQEVVELLISGNLLCQELVVGVPSSKEMRFLESFNAFS